MVLPHPLKNALPKEISLMRSALCGLERYKFIGKFDTISVLKNKRNRFFPEAYELPNYEF